MAEALNKYYINRNAKDTEHNFYIHLLAKNIGRGYPSKKRAKNGFSDSKIFNIYKSQRNEVQKAVLNQLKNYMINNIRGSVSVREDTKKLINLAFSTQESSFDLLDQMDKGIKNSLKNIDDQDVLRGVMEAEIDLAKNKKEKYLNFITNTKEGLKDFNDFITLVIKTLNLLNNNKLADLLLLNLNNEHTMASFSNTVIEEIEVFKNKYNGKVMKLDDQGALKVAIELQNVLKQFLALSSEYNINNITKEEKESIVKSLTTSLENNLFSTAFGEWAGAKATQIATNASDKAIMLVGQSESKRALYDVKGTFLKEIGPDASGKEDIHFKNFTVSFTEGENEISMKMDLGISNKFYRTKFFKGLNEYKNSFNFGSGGNVRQGISSIASGNHQLKYLMYNTLGHGEYYLPDSFAEFRRLIILRQIFSLFTSRGKNDFASVLLVNGQVVTIYEILKQAITNFDNITDFININLNNKGGVHVIKEEKLIDGAEKRWDEVYNKKGGETIEATLYINKIGNNFLKP